MKVFIGTQLRWCLLFVLSLLAGVLLVGGHTLLVRAAEQSGGSPTSSSDSRLKQLAVALESLGYGDTATGTWGNWGSYWNRIRSAAEAPFNDALVNGLPNGGNDDFPTAKGGIHDASPLPDGSYSSDWVTCDNSAWSLENPGGNYCNTGESIAEAMDSNTGLVWSSRISASDNWFTANNCAQPGSDENPGTCDASVKTACTCVKLTGGDGNPPKTGCEVQGDGGWRLPYQKERMMAYIDGSAQFLTNSAANDWSGTSHTINIQNAWYTSLSTGSTSNSTKTSTHSFRCVR
jgi:hypothetical protein